MYMTVSKCRTKTIKIVNSRKRKERALYIYKYNFYFATAKMIFGQALPPIWGMGLDIFQQLEEPHSKLPQNIRWSLPSREN